MQALQGPILRHWVVRNCRRGRGCPSTLVEALSLTGFACPGFLRTNFEVELHPHATSLAIPAFSRCPPALPVRPGYQRGHHVGGQRNNELEVRVRPDADFDGLFSSLVFTPLECLHGHGPGQHFAGGAGGALACPSSKSEAR